MTPKSCSLFLLANLLLAGPLSAADTITPGAFYVEPSTFHSLGFQWKMAGDDNRNAQVAVQFREAGVENWNDALDLLRIHGEEVGSRLPEKAYICGNLFAGSVLFLQPGTSYEVRLTLTDPDQPGEPVAVQKLEVATKVEPRPFAGGKEIHVNRGEDFAAAYASAQPGDHVVLHAGTYHGTFELEKQAERDKPIVIRDAGDGPVIFQPDPEKDGKVNTVPILNSDEEHWHLEDPCFNVSNSTYHWIEGITFRNYYSGIASGDGGPVTGLTVRHCTFEDSGWAGLFLRSVMNRDVWIADNVFVGTQGTWHRKEAKKFPYKGVWINGQGIDVCYNRAQNHKDGISIYGKSGPTDEFERTVAGIDFYNNDVGQSWDDNEADDGQHNIRFFCNRFVDQHVGLSAQPINGGPCYFIRNLQYNVTRSSAFKLNVDPAGVLIYHNTTFCSGKGTAMVSKDFSNCHIFNNLFYGLEGPTLSAGPKDRVSQIDYNGYTWTGGIEWTPKDPETGKNKRKVFKSFEEFHAETGQSGHAVLVEWDDLVDVPKPEKEAKTIVDLNFGDPRLKPSVPAVDAGKPLPNLDFGGFEGEAPDLGAIELGQELPHYGPRSRGE